MKHYTRYEIGTYTDYGLLSVIQCGFQWRHTENLINTYPNSNELHIWIQDVFPQMESVVAKSFGSILYTSLLLEGRGSYYSMVCARAKGSKGVN